MSRKILQLIDAQRKNIYNSILFMIPSIVNFVITIFTFPIYSKILSAYDFALIGYFESITAIILPVMNFSFFTYYMKRYYEIVDEDERKILISSIVKFILIMNLLLFVIVFAILGIYFKMAGVMFPISPYFIIIFLTNVQLVIVSLIGIDFKIKKKGLSFVLLNTGVIIMSTFFSLFLIYSLDDGSAARLLGPLLSYSVVFFILFKKMNLNIKMNKKIISAGIIFGYPLVIMALLDFPILNLDRILLEQLKNIDELANYNIAIKISSILTVLSSSMYAAFEPDIYKHARSNTKNYKILFFLIFSTLFAVTLLFSFIAPFSADFLTSGVYKNSSIYINGIIWSNFFMFLTYFFTVPIIIAGKTKKLLIRKIIVASFSVLISYFLVSNFQFFGAVYSKLIINILNALSIYVLYLWVKKKDGENIIIGVE